MDETITQLCNDLNLDKQTADDVLQVFNKVSNQFMIEGDKNHWLACAIYTTTNKVAPASSTDLPGNNETKPASTAHSNPSNHGLTTTTKGVSLTQLLRLCSLSLVDFLGLMKKWLTMTESPTELRSKISHLERNFNISAVVFKKYKEIFDHLFKPINAGKTRSTSLNQAESDKVVNRTRKSNLRMNYELTTADIYYYCWVLYINIKATRPAISEDLVNSYHLLLACIDFCYTNALVSKFAHEVLNPEFEGLPKDFHSDSFKMKEPTKQSMCILQVLCNNWDGIAVDAKSIREHWLRPYISDLVQRKVLQASPLNDQPNIYVGVFDSSNFENNMMKLKREHDLTMLSIGDFDERIFLSENAQKELGAPVYDLSQLKKMINERDANSNSSPPNQKGRTNLSPPDDVDDKRPSLENGGRFVPQTPLSNRNYMANKAPQPSSPVANATRKVGDLYRMLSDCTGEPSSSLEDVFKLCTRNPRESIMDRASKMVDKFLEAYASDQDEPQAKEMARKRVDLARKLYFKVLESIIVREQKRLPTDRIGDSLSSLLSHEIFHISLFACCVEIVLASHNAKRTFPWILDVYKDFGETRLYPFLFYKVIELVIREEERLSRDIVKHLASIEERVLDSMAWESDSPLWTAIAANGSIPSNQDVTLPPTNNEQNPFEMSPLSSLRNHGAFQSPMTVSNRYSISSLVEGNARRRLFDGGLSGDGSTTASSQPQILQVVMPHRMENGDVRYVVLNANPLEPDHASQQREIEHSPAPIRPAVKANPVNLFFRKVYYLAQLRFRDLWNRLSINSNDLKRKIWTLFEDQLKNHTNLLRDRHLDQMIMCATYSVIKVCKPDRSSHFFRQILTAYRFQPQANVKVFQDVLLAKPPLKSLDDGAGRTTTVNLRSPSRRAAAITSPARNGSGQSSAGSTSSNQSSNPLPERGDLIDFYNQVYIKQVRNIMIRFATQPDSSLNLSPLPRMNTNPTSPFRRVSQQHSVYVSPLKSNSLPASPVRQLSYNFHRSPAKDLQTINSMINKQRTACKRILQDDDGENTKRPCTAELTRRINDLRNDRRGSNNLQD